MTRTKILSGDNVVNWKVRNLLTIQKHNPNFAISIGKRRYEDDILVLPELEELIWEYRTW